jgi:putative transposase
MQIIGLNKNVYELYAWARTQECLDVYRIKYDGQVRHWGSLRAEGVCVAKCAEFVGISRAF